MFKHLTFAVALVFAVAAVADKAGKAGPGAEAAKAVRAAAPAVQKANTPVLKTAVFICDKCGYESDAPGVCPKDGGKLKRHRVRWVCDKDQFSATTPGVCPKCGATLERKVLTGTVAVGTSHAPIPVRTPHAGRPPLAGMPPKP